MEPQPKRFTFHVVENKSVHYNTDINFTNVARIPWLPGPSMNVPQLQNILSLEHNTLVCIENKLRVLETFARAFPAYLPGRYHRMDVPEILKHSVDGSHWEKVNNYLSSATDYATTPFYNLERGGFFNTPAKVDSTIEPCGPAAEFLLEPRVIIQLPFQPALLHQWAVAAYAESLIFSKRLIEIGTRGYAPQFHDLYTKLAHLSQELSKNTNFYVAKFFDVYCANPEENVHIKAREVFPPQDHRLRETLAFLEFVLDDKCAQVFEFIKLKSWAKDVSPMDLKFSTDCGDIGSLNLAFEPFSTVYSDMYWRDKVNFWGSGLPQVWIPEMLCVKTDESDTRTAINIATAKKYLSRLSPEFVDDPDVYLKVIKSQIRFAVLKNPGPLRSMPETNFEEFFDDPEKFMDPEDFTTVKSLFLIYWLYKDESTPCNTDSWASLSAEGVIPQLLSLQSEVFAEHALGVITRLIWWATKKFHSGVYLDFSSSRVPSNFSLLEFSQWLDNVLDGQDKWSFETLLTELSKPNDFGSFWDFIRGKNCICCDDLVARRTLKELQVMATLAPTVHHKGLDDNQTEFLLVTEFLIEQYIFPCFMVTWFDIIDKPDLECREKMAYVLFFINLDFKYSNSRHIHTLDANRKPHFYNNYTFLRDWHSLKCWCSENLNYPNFSSTLRKISHIFEEETGDIIPIHRNPNLFLPSEYEMLTWRLFNRMRVLLVGSDCSLESHTSMVPEILSACQFVKNYWTLEDAILHYRIVHGNDEKEYKNCIMGWCKKMM